MNIHEEADKNLKELFNSSVAMRNLALFTMAQKFPLEFLQAVDSALSFDAIQSKISEIIVPAPLYKVVLLDMGQYKLECIKLVREITGGSLCNSKGLVEVTAAGHERTIKRDLPRQVAVDICDRFRAVGSNATIQLTNNVPDLAVKDYQGNDIQSF